MLVPIVSVASPVISQGDDAYEWYGAPGDANGDGYAGGSGYDPTYEDRRADGVDRRRRGGGNWGWKRDSHRDDWQPTYSEGKRSPVDRGEPLQPWVTVPRPGRYSDQDQYPSDDWYPDRRRDYERPQSLGARIPTESGRGGYGYPADGRGYGYPGDPRIRERDAPVPRSSYRFRGARDAAALPGTWWGGYRFRPLTDAEIHRMRSDPGAGAFSEGWPRASTPNPGRARTDEAFGYQPDSWFRRYYGDAP